MKWGAVPPAGRWVPVEELAAFDAVGLGPSGARLAQFALGTLNTILFWKLGDRLAGRTGALVASFGALSGPFVFFEAELLSISLALSLLLLRE